MAIILYQPGNLHGCGTAMARFLYKVKLPSPSFLKKYARRYARFMLFHLFILTLAAH